MLADRDLAGRALDQHHQVFAGEPTEFVAPTLGLCVKLRPVGGASGRRIRELKQAARRTVGYVGLRLGGHHATLASPIQVTPITG
jgi:hypothetical protein